MKCHAGADHGPATFYKNAGWLCDSCWCWMYLRGLLPLVQAITFMLVLTGCDVVYGLERPDADVAIDAVGDAKPNDGAIEIDAAPACTQELLVNGSFDAASTAPWIEQPAMLIIDQGVADTPPKFAALETANLIQRFAIPANATALTLQGRWRITTAETTAADMLTMTLDGAQVPSFTLDSSLAAASWEPFVAQVQPFVAGSTRELWIIASDSNGVRPTTFYLDSLSIIARTCP